MGGVQERGNEGSEGNEGNAGNEGNEGNAGMRQRGQRGGRSNRITSPDRYSSSAHRGAPAETAVHILPAAIVATFALFVRLSSPLAGTG